MGSHEDTEAQRGRSNALSLRLRVRLLGLELLAGVPEYRYLLGVFYVPDWGYDDVYVIEAGGKAPAFDRHRKAVDEFIARLYLQ